MIRSLLFIALVATTVPAVAVVKKTSALDAEFAASDANKDGVLSRAEIDARTARMHLAGGKVAPADMKLLGDVWFARADANHDGRITRAEMTAIVKVVASRYDTNHDGTVSVAERQAARTAAIREVQAKPGAGR